MTHVSDVEGSGPTLHMPDPRQALRHAAPVLLEGVVAPVLTFYLALVFTGFRGALIAALGWSGFALTRRVVRGDRISTVLILDVVLLSIRTVVAFITGNAILYFLQPMAWSVLISIVLIGSAIAQRPFTQRFAQDFCPFDPDLLARPRVQGFFVRVSLLWAAVLLVNTGFALWLLLSSSLKTFALERTAMSWTLTAVAIGCSIFGFTATMRRDGFKVQWGGFSPSKLSREP
ncbi:MAG TPA: VC0807 family protein [Acidimicrobiales bacterium]|jgi:hypothetical protein|nr:VC0807 family protein [Acidimicrobiales bacterium]